MALEGGQGIFQPDTESAYHQGAIELFLVLVLGEMGVPDPSAFISNEPNAVTFFDYNRSTARQYLFVKRVGYNFSNGMTNLPIFQDLLYVEIKTLARHLNSLL